MPAEKSTPIGWCPAAGELAAEVAGAAREVEHASAPAPSRERGDGVCAATDVHGRA